MEVGSLAFHKLVTFWQVRYGPKGEMRDRIYNSGQTISYMTIQLWPTTSLQQPLQEVKLQPLQQVYHSGQDVVSRCQLPYFLPLLPAQDQPEKARYAPQTNYIWCPAFVLFYFIFMVDMYFICCDDWKMWAAIMAMSIEFPLWCKIQIRLYNIIPW